MPKMISKKVQNIQPSGIRRFFDLVLGMKEVISLGVGEPDFVTPWPIREAGIYSLEEGFTSYTSNKGLYKLRLTLNRYLKNRYGLEYDPDNEILITVGVSEGVDLALRAIIDPNDKILIPSPSYVSYGPVTELAGGRPIYIDTRSTGFKLTPQLLEKYIDKNTKAIILNYPNNPTGISYTKRELEEFKKLILKNKIFCISDEIYGELTYDFEHTPFATLKEVKPYTIYLNGFSKAYAMTGWRVGFACGPEEVISAMNKIHQYTIMCVPITSQIAACEALVGGRSYIEQMKKEYKRRRQYVLERLNALGLEFIRPQGAFYVFASIKKTGLSAIEFASQLLKQEKIAVVPGDAFGKKYSDYIRISYASKFDNLKEAFNRIEKFLKRRQKDV
ncbi:MAG: aminotransferase class I/II-fold pyridoxal phosphate-dependent enzyme [Candidatus Omnitrophica bacterium]|nr:aminotransferase class I/II-fold pyridoxal phosphate-dependent enzyme [Candidatus Omnitrophota bacterium]